MKEKTLKQFAAGINAYLKAHPDHANLPVVSAADDEGNGYNLVFYDPTHGTQWETRSGTEVVGVCVT